MDYHILVTNDDGVTAPGLSALAHALSAVGRVTVIAPERNWSAAGHSKTLRNPLHVESGTLANGLPALVTNGSPTDAVVLGLTGLAELPVHLVVAGVNNGPNLGQDVIYSGTVAAATEAAIAGIPAIAVSLATRDSGAETCVAASFAARLAQVLLTKGLPSRVVLNVNVPALPLDLLRGVRVTRMGVRIYHDELVRYSDPYGKPYFWIGGRPPEGLHDAGTDIWALEQGYISVTPLQMDYTAYTAVGQLRDWGIEDGAWGDFHAHSPMHHP